MLRSAVALVLALSLGACAENPFARPETGQTATSAPAPAPAPEVSAPTAPPPAVAAAPAALDTVSEEEKQAARDTAAAAPSGGVLGEVTVALGDPSDPGLWVKSALVSADRPGTVRTGGGAAIAVTLRPIEGGDGGPQISLSAMQALGLPLVGLHPVTLSGS